MAALLSPDSDDEFGYNFSLEDEEALIQLASNKPSASTSQPPKVKSVIDAVPAVTETPDGNRDVVASNTTRAIEPQEPWVEGHAQPPGHPIALEQQPALLPSPVSLYEDVAYPNCMIVVPRNALGRD